MCQETLDIQDVLIKLNQNRLFTINSQPQVNGVPSSDPVYGFGPEKGYVYQKAYFEFFVPPELIEPLCDHLNKFDTVSFQAINAAGNEKGNVSEDEVNAVTWGVFPR
jgi:methylenetetrahydrofolate reductase (NADPH)